VRALLSARSPVFRRVLFGEFLEAASASISIPEWSADTLHAIIEFCYTDDTALFAEFQLPGHVASLITLAKAGDFFELPMLLTRSCRKIEEAIACSPFLACAVVQHIAPGAGIESLEKLRKHAWSVIQSSPRDALLKADGKTGLPGVVQLDSQGMEDLVKDDGTAADEALLFSALRRWSDEGEQEAVPARTGSRKRKAQELACHLKFAKMPPSFLRDSVAPSGLVDLHVLSDAFFEQALLAETSHGVNYSVPRKPVAAEPIFIIPAPSWPTRRRR